jgi:hypothetical protein
MLKPTNYMPGLTLLFTVAMLPVNFQYDRATAGTPASAQMKPIRILPGFTHQIGHQYDHENGNQHVQQDFSTTAMVFIVRHNGYRSSLRRYTAKDAAPRDFFR